MAAKVLENALKVWQRISITGGGGTTTGFSPGTRKLMKALKEWLSTQKSNPNLQFISFTDVTTDSALITTGGELVYAIVLKKQATATDAYFKANNSATTAGGASGAAMQICIPLLDSGDEAILIYPNGLNLSTGMTIAAETTGAGGTDTTTGDGPNGFMLIG
jgi:hypothetical protein